MAIEGNAELAHDENMILKRCRPGIGKEVGTMARVSSTSREMDIRENGVKPAYWRLLYYSSPIAQIYETVRRTAH